MNKRIAYRNIIVCVSIMAGSGASYSQDDVTAEELVGRLDLERYKSVIKGLTQFGDRRQGTQRNRRAVDWIEQQLQAVGCTNTERIHFVYDPEPRAPRRRQNTSKEDDLTTPTGGKVGRNGSGHGGASIFGYRSPTGVNRDLMAQPDTRIRELNREEPTNGPRTEVYCTKIGKSRPNEMYILGAHMDGHGVNEAVNDNASGSALVMELARIFNSPDVETDVSIRFVLWNNEETGLNGAYSYVEQRKDLQGLEEPPGSGIFPEPKWLGMIQHDMMLWDHGAPDSNGKVDQNQRREADVNIEFQSNSYYAEESMKLAFVFKAAADKYNTDYPATVSYTHLTLPTICSV